eukprot:CAMPEP_0197643252 /NCGR_PEP_ID=MMETSP1338-20131121/16643_1 /TAXON_ID=43686 ORGANISM="Pelagodinium beii, Strain RCC1491" /NCGR_SAMPLE_ID=MMETSP1338 /ASSEMBLY_ACC=CAM_ASM_000754 /LENGTH=56 /DNA_ID=CAMNT_0043216489 /DNA_START=81 /DNA_END=248 /DNA_ORIENTATION=+
MSFASSILCLAICSQSAWGAQFRGKPEMLAKANVTASQFMETNLGPFDTEAEACDY